MIISKTPFLKSLCLINTLNKVVAAALSRTSVNRSAPSSDQWMPSRRKSSSKSIKNFRNKLVIWALSASCSSCFCWWCIRTRSWSSSSRSKTSPLLKCTGTYSLRMMRILRSRTTIFSLQLPWQTTMTIRQWPSQLSTVSFWLNIMAGATTPQAKTTECHIHYRTIFAVMKNSAMYKVPKPAPSLSISIRKESWTTTGKSLSASTKRTWRSGVISIRPKPCNYK